MTFGDKVAEGTGPTIVKRRAEFVSGERHDNPEDLAKYVHDVRNSEAGRQKGITTVDHTRLLVYALESLLRIHGLKPLSGFPQSIQPAVQKRREMESQVYYGVIKSLGFTSEHGLMTFGLRTGYPNLAENREKILQELKCASSTPQIGYMAETIADDAARLVLNYARAQVGQPALAKGGGHYQNWMRRIAAESRIDPVAALELRLR